MNQPKRVGLLAGWGRYPIVVAEALRAQGCEVYCIGLAGHAEVAEFDLDVGIGRALGELRSRMTAGDGNNGAPRAEARPVPPA